MSRAIASARQRRAGIEPTVAAVPTSNQSATQNSTQNGLTLPQVISLVDTRLMRLEQFMKESQETQRFSKPIDRPIIEKQESNSVIDANPDELTDLNQILEEYNNRFVLLAEEIGQMKDALMKLQTYTMDVNKMLLEERVNVLSDLGNDTSTYTMNAQIPIEEIAVEDLEKSE
jgi:hypothetical protein